MRSFPDAAGRARREFLVVGEGDGDGFVHVPVGIAAEAAAEDGVGAGRGGFGAVLGEDGGVFGGADGVEGVVVGAGREGVFAVDDRPLEAALGREVGVLVGARPGDRAVAFVDDGGALPVGGVLDFLLPADAAPTEAAVLVAEEAVDGAGVDQRGGGREAVADVEVVGGEAQFDVRVVEQAAEPGTVAVAVGMPCRREE